jgi:two-component system chemotaxis response regulator CheB
MPYEAVVIGASAGGLQALKALLSSLPTSFPLPIAIVQHIAERSENLMAELLNHASRITVKEAEDKESLNPGTVYLAPPGYHLLIEPDRSLSLSVDERVNHARPSIDVLFESAAEVFDEALIGIILTGANADGAQGLKTIKEYGGLTIVQNPESAETPAMPKAALAATEADYIVDLEQLTPILLQLAAGETKVYGTNG